MSDPRYEVDDLQRILRSMQQDYRTRDARLAIRRALLYRRTDEIENTGQHITQPFDKMETVLRQASGELVTMAQQRQAKVAANPAIVQVNLITSGDRAVSERMQKNAANVENFLNGISYAVNNNEHQMEIAWEQITSGCGFYFTYEAEAGFGLPDREYFEELTDDEISKLRSEGRVSVIPTERNGKEAWPESADLWQRRKIADSEGKARSGASLWVEEVVPWGSVYLRVDKAGIKYAAIVESVPFDSIESYSDLATSAAKMYDKPEYEKLGLMVNKEGAIIGGLARGGEPGESDSPSTVTLVKFLTREEIYYYVCTSRSYDKGMIVFHTAHDYARVPLFPAPFTRTTSNRPEEMYLSDLEAAFAYVPGINQLSTLLSNVAVWNATPRYWVKRKDGLPALDPATGEPQIIALEQAVGTDPTYTAVVDGELQQLTIGNSEFMLQVLEFYSQRLASALPSESETGGSGGSGPAWTTRLLQAAANIRTKPPVDNHANAMLEMQKMRARVMRQRGGKYFLMGAPGMRGDERTLRALIEVDAEDFSENLGVRQDSNTMEERITLMQVGDELRTKGRIDDRQFYEEYMGEDDPVSAIRRKYVQMVLDYIIGVGQPLPPGSLLAAVADRVLGRLDPMLVDQSPQVAQSVAERIAGAGGTAGNTTLGGGISEAAGIRQPGVGMPAVQADLPAPAGAPLGGAMVAAAQ